MPSKTACEHQYGTPVWRYYFQHPEAETPFAEAMGNVTEMLQQNTPSSSVPIETGQERTMAAGHIDSKAE